MLKARTILALAGFSLIATAASAHTPYLVPSSFAPDRAFVTVEAAMTEGNFFVPDFPIRPGDYSATGPDGQTVSLGAGTVFKEFGVIEVPLPTTGTWRIGTGERPGRTMTWAKVDGEWRPVRAVSAGAPAPMAPAPGAPASPTERRPEGEPGRVEPIEDSAVPVGAETMQVQAFVKAETYVSRGAPTTGALKPTGVGFEFAPKTHPNELYAGEAFKFGLIFDGKPLSGVEFAIARGGDAYAERRFNASGKSDAVGLASVTFADPGVYVIEIHYPGPVASNLPPAAKTVVYSLTLEVTR